MKTPLEKIMNEGWKEVLEFGFGRQCVIYERENERMAYDCVKEEIIIKYLTRKK